MSSCILLDNETIGEARIAKRYGCYPRKKQKSERVKALSDLIMRKFEEGGLAAFREWSGVIHDQVIESLPQTAVDVEMMDTEQQLPLVKILEWDSGKYLIL